MTIEKNIENLTEKFLTDGLTAREQAALQQLLKVSENKDYFKKMYQIWNIANQANNKEDVAQGLQRTLFRIHKQKPQKQEDFGWFFSLRKLAAAVLISFTLGSVFYHILHLRKQLSASSIVSMETSKVMVPLGSRSQVELPDGTLVSINAGSNLYYRSSFGQETREVWLEGEAYFKVTKGSSIPFTVNAKDVTIKALGTEFNVKAYPEEKTVQTTLVNGLVVVRQTNTDDDSKEIVLKPKQSVTIFEQTATENIEKVDDITLPATNQMLKTENSESNEVTVNLMTDNTVLTDKTVLKDNIKTELYTSWKDTRWVFESEPLSDLAMKLQRRYDVQIIIADDALKQYPFNGILADETLEQVLEIMKSIAPINYTIRKKTVTLSINPRHRKVFDEQMKKQ